MIEKYFVIHHWDGKTYQDGGIALVRDSQEKPGEKEIIAIGVYCTGGYIVEEWPSSWYKHLGDNQLELDDSIWEAVIRFRDAQDSDSKNEENEAKVVFEAMIGNELQVKMHLAGAGI